MNFKDRFYIILAGIFIASLVTCNLIANKFVTIEAFNTSAFMKVYKTNFQEIFKFFLEAIKEINKILSLELPGDLSELILANVKKNLANYSYLCAVVSKIHSDYPNLIVYHSGSSFFSAVTRRIGVRTRYLLHGLMGQVGKLSYPIYDQIHVYCKEEAEYLRKISPKSEVKLYSFKDMKDFKKKIVIAIFFNWMRPIWTRNFTT